MPPFQRKPLWYKDAVIYEVHVKTYADSDGSGMGDFRGLISKLDYIRDLGVNAIWLLPFYPSPLRDDGYDIADYHTVNPAYGTIEIFREFLAEAHARGIHVITEIVINHTSDKHPWFQRARHAPAGSPERDFYVWSATKEKYGQARIIFTDTEPSNWTWDPVAKSHYWHRFFSHQPDLNFDNPAVHEAVLEILDYWLAMGVDGLRLDAIPYLYEREGTNCENLPETHAFLRKLSKHVHDKFENVMLLAEANQWPHDAAEYFGDPVLPQEGEPRTGASCDMAFHFPLMTRLYMAVEMEDRFPIVDILEQTPPIPPDCQWAIFLRNHDELTLEMVTDEERDYMYRVFAKDRRARINVGIRRRLAPLLGNNRRKIELLNKLLLSMPGTPVIYYGDEIGMGDNYYLGDRDGVRTPMQWNPDRNAGFSRAPAQKLYLPVIADAEFHYEAVNVEIQEGSTGSLLWWMRRQIRLRQAHPVFGRGGIRFLESENTHILAYVRESDEEAVLVLANLSQYPQTARLDLGPFRGAEPVELSGGQRFPVIAEESWPVMLGGHDSLWIQLRGRAEDLSREIRMLPDAGEWDSLEALARAGLEPAVLAAHTVQSLWFEGKKRLLVQVRSRESLAPRASAPAFLLLLRAEFLNGDPEDYSLWVGYVPEGAAETLPPQALIARARLAGQAGYLCEAQHLPEFRVFLVGFLLGSGNPDGENKVGRAGGRLELQGMAGDEPPHLPARFTTRLVDGYAEEFRVLLRGRVFLRWFRRLREGLRADLEVLTQVKRRFPKARVPVTLVHANYRPPSSSAGPEADPVVLGYAQRFVHADRNALDLARESLKHFLERIALAPESKVAPPLDGLIPKRLDFQTLPEILQDSLGGTWAEFVHLLGRRLAELHRALSHVKDPDFTPEPFSLLHQHSLYHSIRSRVRRALSHLERHPEALPEDARSLGAAAVALQPALLARLARLTAGRIDARRLRIHGSLRLDRVLFTGKDFVFTSFDGPPWLGFPERRFKFSPLMDVAAMIRDLDHQASLETAAQGPRAGPFATGPEWALYWAELSAGLFLDGYLDASVRAAHVPVNTVEMNLLLESFLIERAAVDVQGLLAAPERAVSALRMLLRPDVEPGA
jgi:maltose alpha-D-glucosyltransferase/alpha-amylase